MVDHEGADAGPPPLWMDQQEGDVGLVVLHVWNHETEADHHLLIQDDHAKVWVLEALGQVHAWKNKTWTVKSRRTTAAATEDDETVLPGQKLS